MVESKILTIPRNGLLAEYLLDGNAYDTNDGTKNNGTATNVTYANTSVGYQKQYGGFAGGSTSMMIVNSGFPAITNSFTISLWIANTNLSQSGTYVYEKGHSGVNNQHAIIYGYVPNSYEFFSGVFRGGTIAISDTKFHHVVYEYDGTTFRAYLDNALVSSSSASFSLNYVNGAFVYGQTNGYGSGTKHNAQAIRFYNRPLTDSERLALWLEGKRKLGNEGYQNLMKDCVAYFDFRGDAIDVIGGQVGTVTNATLTSDHFGIANSGYNFVPASSRILLPNVSPFNAANNFTVIQTVRVPTVAPTSGTENTSWSNGYGNIYVSTQGRLTFTTYPSGPSPYEISSATGGFSPGDLIQIACSISSTAGAKLYRNGELVASSPSSTGNISVVTTALAIGGRFFSSTWAGWEYSGDIIDTAFFAGQQTDEFVNRWYQQSLLSKPYPFTKSRPSSIKPVLLLDGTVRFTGTRLADTSFYSDANLVRYWTMDDLTEKNGNTLTNYSATTTTGKYGGGYAGTGTQYLSNSTPTGITTGACTISLWGRVDGNHPGNDHPQLVNTSSESVDVMYGIGYNQTNTQIRFSRLRQAIAWQEATYSYSPTIGAWNHYVLTYDGSNIRGYLNGNLVAGPTAASGTGSGTTPDGVSMLSRGGQDFFNGAVDDVGMFNRALSASEVAQLYGEMKAYDQSGNGNHATLDASQSVVRRMQSKALVFAATDKASFPNINGVVAMSAWIYPTANNKVIATIAATKTVSINASNVLTSANLTSPVYYVNGKVGTALTLNKWQHVMVTFSAENTSSGSFGSDSFTGWMGDMALYTESPAGGRQQVFHSTYIQ